MSKNYYKILGIAQNATKDEIKKRYRELAHKHHPDKGGDEARFKEINEAYQVLSDDRKRTQYDQFGQVFEGAAGRGSTGQQGGFEWPGGFRVDFGGSNEGGGEFDFSDIFEDFFSGGFGGGGTRSRAKERRGKDIRIDLDIPFEESILSGKREIELKKTARCLRCNGIGGEPGTKMKTCATCQGKGNIQKTQRTFLGSFTQVGACHECGGSGKRPEETCHQCRGRGIEERTERLEIFIPKGVRDGEILKISGKGEISSGSGIPGDLLIYTHVPPHPVFRRQGDNIIMQLTLKLSQAILGDSLNVETLDGPIKLKIPEGTQPGDILKIRGKGAYTVSGYERGDLLIEIKVTVPKKLSRKGHAAVEELKEEGA